MSSGVQAAPQLRERPAAEAVGGTVSLAPSGLYVLAYLGSIMGVLASSEDLPRLQGATLASATVYTVVALAVRSQRVRFDHILSPSNWMAMGWFLQLVLVPTLVATFGPTRVNLMARVDDSQLASAVLFQIGAFIAYAIGRGLNVSRERSKWPSSVHGGVVFTLLLVGLASLIGYFGGMGQVARYFTGLVGAASGIPYLSFGASLLGTAGVLWVARRVEAGRAVIVSVIGSVGLLVLAFGTSGYSRGMAICAVIALLGALSLHWRRIPLSFLASVGVVTLIGALALGAYRSEYLLAESGYSPSSSTVESNLDPRSQVELYMRGPQYLGVVAGGGDEDLSPQILLNSLLAPIPYVGASYRDDTTRQYFSGEVRGTTTYADISPPLVGEMVWVFGAIGLFVFILVGRLVRLLDAKFFGSRNLGQAYVWVFAGVWVGYILIGSIQVAMQALVVAGIPLAVLYWLSSRKIPRGSLDEGVDPDSSVSSCCGPQAGCTPVSRREPEGRSL